MCLQKSIALLHLEAFSIRSHEPNSSYYSWERLEAYVMYRSTGPVSPNSHIHSILHRPCFIPLPTILLTPILSNSFPLSLSVFIYLPINPNTYLPTYLLSTLLFTYRSTYLCTLSIHFHSIPALFHSPTFSKKIILTKWMKLYFLKKIISTMWNHCSCLVGGYHGKIILWEACELQWEQE